jgi:hypothetical protein
MKLGGVRTAKGAPPANHEPGFFMRIHTILYTVARIPNAIARERYPFLSRIMVSHKRQKNTIKMPAASRMSGFIKFHCSISRTKKRSHIRDATTLARTNTILFVSTVRSSLRVVVSDLIARCPSPCLQKAGRVALLCLGRVASCIDIGAKADHATPLVDD